MFYLDPLPNAPLRLRGATVAFDQAVAPRAPGLRYRADIDGLRAVAVVAVVLFHLDVDLIKGGYVGVDIFFVISGYLITNVLVADIRGERFSILAFYDRRIRRIFPALFAMMLATGLAALVVLLPPEIVDLSKSVIAATLFSSNMYFMEVTDYFNSSGNVAPLLHTWSLAVEEQFYFVFPLLLYGLRHVSRPTRLLVLGGLGVLSFGLSVELVRTDQVMAFYLAPSRAWELLLGSMIALGAFPPLRRSWLREAVAGLGALLIVASLVTFYAAMPFPGVRALAPCLGAACVLQAGEGGSSQTARLLSLKPIVFVGLISYSLYLWHWPIIVFTRLWWVAPLGAVGDTVVLGASVAAGTLSWWFIERPYRLRSHLQTPARLRLAASAAMAGAVLLAVALLASNGSAVAVPPEVSRVAGFIHYDDRPVYRRGSCFLDSHVDTLAAYDPAVCLARSMVRPDLLVIGDSHAAHLWSGLRAAFPDADVLQATASGCKPVFDGKGVATCVGLVDLAFARVMSPPAFDAVILSARWGEDDVPSLLRTVDRLAPHVKHLYVAGPIVEYREALPRLLALAKLRGSTAPLIVGRLSDPADIDESLRSALAGHPATYLSAYRALCPSATQPCTTEAADGTPVQWDYGHLTAQGSASLVEIWRASGLLRSP